jgi:methionyl-tRNA formyltransferase
MKKLLIAKSNLAVAYFGTPYFSANFLEKILIDKTLPVEVKLVVTQPDRPVGKKQILTPSPVKEIAIKYNIAVDSVTRDPFSPARLGYKYRHPLLGESPHSRHLLQSVDLALVCAYGQIIPQDLLALPKYGFWNIHFSLLPQYRGPSPVAYALMAGEEKTGVTIFQMDEKIDHGPIIAQEKMEIAPTDRRPDLEIKLTDLAFSMFKKLIEPLSNNSRAAASKLYTPQNEKEATYTKLLKKSDGFIPLSFLQKALKNEPLQLNELPEIIKKYQISNIKYQKHILNIKYLRNSAEIIYNLFRGLFPWPGLWTILPPTRCNWDRPKRLKITQLSINNQQLTINRVQLEGKNEVDFETFNQAYKIF